jgi:hypothetical protein
MIYIVIGLILFILALRWLAPTRYAVHASRAERLPHGVSAEGKWLLGGFVYDQDGKHIDIANKFIGHAAGNSMLCYSIPSGATFIGDQLDEHGRKSLVHGDIVVVDGVAEFSETGFRLRAIDALLPDGRVSFLRDGLGRQPRVRDLSEVYARVTYVIENNRVGNSEWASSILQSVRDIPAKLFKRAA